MAVKHPTREFVIFCTNLFSFKQHTRAIKIDRILRRDRQKPHDVHSVLLHAVEFVVSRPCHIAGHLWRVRNQTRHKWRAIWKREKAIFAHARRDREVLSAGFVSGSISHSNQRLEFMLYSAGRFLQFVGMLILPIAMAGEIAESHGLGRMLQWAIVGIVVFGVGWSMQQYSGKK